jgi:hypothetical protein
MVENQRMKLERSGSQAFTLTVAAVELSSLIAAVRIAADVLDQDDTPPEAVAQLRALLDDYERAVARLKKPDGRSRRPSNGSSGSSTG